MRVQKNLFSKKRMKTIFVVGNGFDLAHELKTSYGNFIDSLTTHTINNNALLLIVKDHLKTGNWSDIEYVYFLLLKNSDNLYNFAQKEFHISLGTRTYSSQDLDKNFTEVKALLEEYLENEQKKLTLIDEYSKLFKTFNDSDTLILDFNYTNTISKYLESFDSKIQHIKIHGEIKSESNPIIFGYAANDEEAKLLTDKNDEYLMKNIKKLRYLLSDNESRFKIMINNSAYLIDTYILGHSCGISDRLILNELFTHKDVQRITTFYYENRDNFLKTVINIDRVINDYVIANKKERSFHKLSDFKSSFPMPQQNRDSKTGTDFNYILTMMKSKHDSKQNRYNTISSF